MRSSCAVVLTLAPIALTASAVADHIQMDPRATYLRTSGDGGALDAPALVLADLGLHPGDWVKFERTGSFALKGNAPDDTRLTIGVFSAGGALLGADQPERVPGALAAEGGLDVVSMNTYFGNEPTDIAADFRIDDGSAFCTVVRVPLGATDLFLSPNDGLFQDNSDPNGDYGVDYSVVAAPCYPDFVNDCALDVFDFLAFVNAFNASDPAADCTGDGGFDLFDFLCFVSAFNAGC